MSGGLGSRSSVLAPISYFLLPISYFLFPTSPLLVSPQNWGDAKLARAKQGGAGSVAPLHTSTKLQHKPRAGFAGISTHFYFLLPISYFLLAGLCCFATLPNLLSVVDCGNASVATVVATVVATQFCCMRSTLLLFLLFLLAGCNNNRAMGPGEPRPAVADTTTSAANAPPSPADTTAMPAATSSDSARLAKRLEELDRRIATAPPDSVEALDAEYRHVIDSAMAAQGKQSDVVTGPELTAGLPTNQPTESTVRRQPNDSAAIAAAATATPTTSTVRRQPAGSSASTPTTIDDPGKVFKGLRPDELRTAPAYQSSSTRRRTPPAASPQSRVRRLGRTQQPTAVAKKAKRKRRDADVQQETAARATATEPAATTETSERQLERRYVDGVASARAGNYADAASKLEPVVNSTLSKARREEARYYYARSLEGLGRTTEALRNYNTLSNGSGSLKHRAYLDYCRLLANNGQKERARTMLRSFIRSNPNSRQTPDAQALLQTL